MKQILLVGIGGFLGAISRYLISTWLPKTFTSSKFPVSTFTVNVLGCLIIGFFYSFSEHHISFDSNFKLLLFTGLLGGFTTFSAFGLETIILFQQNEFFTGIAYAAGSFVLCLVAVWLGIKIGG